MFEFEAESSQGGSNAWFVKEACEVVAVDNTVQVWSEPFQTAEPVELVGILRGRDVVLVQSVCDVDGRWMQVAVHVVPGLWVRKPGPGGKDAGDEWKRIGGRGGWIHGRWAIDNKGSWTLHAINNGHPVVCMRTAPSVVLRYRVAQSGVVSRTCPHLKGDVAKMHRLDELLEVTDVLPGGWVRHIRWVQGMEGKGVAFRSLFAREEFLEFQAWAHASRMPSDDTADHASSTECAAQEEVEPRKMRVKSARAEADAIAKAIENACATDGTEVFVTVDLILVFARPSLRSLVVGVIQRHDVVVVGQGEHGWPTTDYLRVLPGSWLRHMRSRESLYQVSHSCWIRRAQSGTSQDVVSPVGFPEVLRFEVVCPHVAEYACMSTSSEAVLHVWSGGEVVEEAAEELPGGWVRIVRGPGADRKFTDEDAKRCSPPTRSSYMLGSSWNLEPCLLPLASWAPDILPPVDEASDAVQASGDFQSLGNAPDAVQAHGDHQPVDEAPCAVQASEDLQPPGEEQDAVWAPDDLQPPGEAPDVVQAPDGPQPLGEAPDVVQAPKDFPPPGHVPHKTEPVASVSPKELQPTPEQDPKHDTPSKLPPPEKLPDEAPVDLLPLRDAPDKQPGMAAHVVDSQAMAAAPQPPWPDTQRADAQGEAGAPQPLRVDTHRAVVQKDADPPQPPAADVQGADAQDPVTPQPLVVDAQLANAQWMAGVPQAAAGVPQAAPEAQQSCAVAAATQKATTTSELGNRRPAAYYGICDLKYDKHRMPGQRVYVLELGNGRLSRFSGHGEHIPRKFHQDYKISRQIDRSALVDNKKMTHDIFSECFLGHLRPNQVCYPRVYTPDLARNIAQGLAYTNEKGGCHAPVVLKLLNRCRGAGVMVARPGEDLDNTLHLLLNPSEKYLSHDTRSMLNDALSSDPDSMEEHCLHWWSNECPVFVAERCELSHWISTESDGKRQRYDATMRVGFVLVHNHDEAAADPQLMAEFLGGYWKLPSEPITSDDVRARCVSKARSGTLPVDPDDLEAVYRELRHALPKVFSFDKAGVGAAMKRYGNDPLLFSFSLARHAAAQLQREGWEKSKASATGSATPSPNAKPLKFLEMAKGRLTGVSGEPSPMKRWEGMDLQEFPARVVASYIERQMGIAEVNLDRCDIAITHFHRALTLHHWNATAEYLVGICHLRMFEYKSAQTRLMSSIRLDPEFKASYITFAVAALALGHYENAELVSAAGLKRHPQAFQCSYNLGLALAFQLQGGLQKPEMVNWWSTSYPQAPCPLEDLRTLAGRSVMALRQAKEQKEQMRTDWSKDDDKLLGCMNLLAGQLEEAPKGVAESLRLLKRSLNGAQGWQLINFRP